MGDGTALKLMVDLQHGGFQHDSYRVHNPGREVRFPGKFPVPGTVRDAFTGPVFWLPGFQIQKSKSQIFWSKTNSGITVAVM